MKTKRVQVRVEIARNYAADPKTFGERLHGRGESLKCRLNYRRNVYDAIGETRKDQQCYTTVCELFGFPIEFLPTLPYLETAGTVRLAIEPFAGDELKRSRRPTAV